MKKLKSLMMLKACLLVLVVFLFSISNAQAQDSDLYDVGGVWNITLVKINANMDDNYFKGLSKTWDVAMTQLVEEGFLKSYKILYGQYANDDDFNLILMFEMENFAFLDPNPERDAKMDEIEKKLVESMGLEWEKTIIGYTALREIIGIKTMREIYFK